MSFEAPSSTLAASGGTASIGVATERECQWSAQPDVSWLTIATGASGQGPGNIQVNAAANIDPITRTGAVVVNGVRAQLTQAAGECVITLGSASASLPQSGGNGSVDVRSSSSLCAWASTSTVDWITIVSGASGKGSGAVTFSVAPTTGPPRTGTLKIAGLNFNVTQSEGCTYAIAPSAYAAGVSGGSGTVAVTAGPGCPWTASSNADWISVAAASGSGPGTVGFTVVATNGPTRTGTLTIAGQVFTVTQSPGCTFAIAPDSSNVPASGGTGNVTVTSASGCAWTAVSDQPWISITSGASGSGNGTVAFTVTATTGPARSGTLTVAGRTYTINQGQGCAFSLSAGSASVPAGGGTGSFDVSTASGCGWSASSSESWLSVTDGASGSGNGTVRYTAAANTGPERTGTITAGGQAFAVTQAAGCSYGISPSSQNVASGGGTTSVAVTVPSGCSWTATSNAGWIAISSGATGSGNGTVQLIVAANAGPPRSGTITVAGQTFTVTQDGGCTIAVAPETITAPSSAGTQDVAVTTAADCTWTATSNASWIGVRSGASGSGNGTVQLEFQANSGPARSGTATIGGRTVTVNQDGRCTFEIAPSTQPFVAGGGSGTVAVTTNGGCSWTATSTASWIIVTSGGSGKGSGTVQFTVEANTTGANRSGTITIAGQTFTVEQAGA